ncbi:OsmC family protein, partial [Nonlabens mediterrranea]|nr:OsmC family protein [Nonlabens mediterrranea]
ARPVATGLASCMITMMGIKARDLEIDLKGSVAQVTKTMAANPRRISQIDVVLNMKGDCDQRAQLILERIANTCPVHQSLHPDIVKNVTFNWS